MDNSKLGLMKCPILVYVWMQPSSAKNRFWNICIHYRLTTLTQFSIRYLYLQKTTLLHYMCSESSKSIAFLVRKAKSKAHVIAQFRVNYMFVSEYIKILKKTIKINNNTNNFRNSIDVKKKYQKEVY